MSKRYISTIDLAGDAHTRGRAFGAGRRREIRAFLSDWLDSLRTVGISDAEAYVTAMLRQTDFLTAIREHAPDFLEEVEGIAVGAEQPQDLILASQLMDEEWAYRPSVLQRAEATQKCSSVAIRSPSGTTWIGQNMDLGPYTEGHQILLRIAPQGAEIGALVFTIGGLIGLLGVNAAKVGICVNSLPQLPAAREGLPVAFVIRRLLQAKSLGEAARVVQTVPHATGQHYLIADPTGILSFEASPAGVMEYRSPNASRVLHTNHPLVKQRDTREFADQASSIARLRSLTDRLMAGEADLETIKAALSSSDDPRYPVCRVAVPEAPVSLLTGVIAFTTGSMISALTEQSDTIASWVTAGPPTPNAYARVNLRATVPKNEIQDSGRTALNATNHCGSGQGDHNT